MSYDRIDWHSGGDYPDDLPPENGGTHIGIYLAWAILNRLEGTDLGLHSSEAIDALRSRKITGRQFLESECDGKLTESDFSEEGNRFAKHYYESNAYLSDYEVGIPRGLPTIYHAEDTWENYDRVAEIIARRYQEWRNAGKKKPWWKFWK